MSRWRQWRPLTRRLTVVAVLGLVGLMAAMTRVPTVRRIELDPPPETPGVAWAFTERVGAQAAVHSGGDEGPRWIWQVGAVEREGEVSPGTRPTGECQRWRVVWRLRWPPVLARIGLVGLATVLCAVAVLGWSAYERRSSPGTRRFGGASAILSAALVAGAALAVTWIPTRVVEVVTGWDGAVRRVSSLHGADGDYRWVAPWQDRPPVPSGWSWYGATAQRERRIDWGVFWVQLTASALCLLSLVPLVHRRR